MRIELKLEEITGLMEALTIATESSDSPAEVMRFLALRKRLRKYLGRAGE